MAEERERSSAAFLSLKALEESSSKLDAENRGLRTEVNCIKGDIAERNFLLKELLSQKSVLEAEVAQLKASRAELVESERRRFESERRRFESVMSAHFGGFVEKVRRYLSDRDVVRPQVLIESQLSGVISCLKLFIDEGIPIPAEKLAENERALSVQTAALDQMEVNDLELSDLPYFSLDDGLTID